MSMSENGLYIEQPSSIERGVKVIADYVKGLPDTPGVYRMLDDAGQALYVGKAKSLKKRVVNYTRPQKQPVRIQRMIARTYKMQFIHTHTEVEALLLEANLIKKLKPRYNVLLRDDKSFPYIVLTKGHAFPQLVKHRGARTLEGQYFGPFANAGSVNRTLAALQKAFMLRNCTDSVFATRSRPCLQYHIKRCTAPCVGYVSEKEYAAQVEENAAFLSGQSRKIQDHLVKMMQKYSKEMAFEKAAFCRDRIKALTDIQAKQDINLEGINEADVVAIYQEEGISCVNIFFFRGGQNFGNKAFFPKHADSDTEEEILSAFLMQFYENKPVPPEIIVNKDVMETSLLEEALSDKAKRKVHIIRPQRGKRGRLMGFVEKNAVDALKSHKNKVYKEKESLAAFAFHIGMTDMPERIEVYDNSHISGTNRVGAMIVAGPAGFIKKAYRVFNVREAEGPDDYAMMREVMKRRFSRALKEGQGPGEENWPDLLLIDGGLGQLNAVHEVLEELNVENELTVLAIAKGPDRNAGRERFFMKGKKEFSFPEKDSRLFYAQRLRDEAHRFAIGAHRTRRKKDMSRSVLDTLSGIGAKRKKALLLFFGSAKSVENAALSDLEKVEGISKILAKQIFDHFHPES